MSNHVTTACIVCGGDICIHPEVYENLRRNHATFYCPAGHGQSFTGKTEDQKCIEQLERSLNSLEGMLTETIAQREELLGVMKECPIPGCAFRSRKQVPRDHLAMGRGVERVQRDLAEHLVAEHGAHARTLAIPERTGV